jgi:glycosyltransferase involved in cell wall biosynthesis
MYSKHRIKLMVLHPTFVFGGAERSIIHILSSLDKERFYIILVTSRKIAALFPPDTVDKLIPIEDLDINIWYSDHYWRDFWLDAFRIAKVLRVESPDIALGMMNYASVILVLAKLFSPCKCKIIASPRGPMMAYFRAFHSKKSFNNLLIKKSFSWSCHLADYLIVASKGLREECICLGTDPGDIKVIPNGIDCAAVQKASREEITGIALSKEYRGIVTAGRLTPEKDIALILRTVVQVRHIVPLKFVIVGDGSERKALEQTARDLEIEEDSTFVGFQSNPFKFFRWADIYVHACIFEGFGNTLVEAMACGCPVIATDCPFGPRDIVEHGKNGLLVDMGSVEAMRDALLAVLQDNDLLTQMGVNALSRSEEFTVGRMVEAYTEVFNQFA